ncbi:hypothetical protein Btru_050603 [Bulinus truncatus]|nr:hypothetical protein Btru_050603 [Bulinus truncatus]
MAKCIAGSMDYWTLISRLSRQTFIIILLCVLLEVALATDEPEKTGTTEKQNTTINATNESQENSSKGSKGVIIAVSVIGVVVFIAVILGVILFKRRRNSLNMDKEKKMQIQMSSARNAGVYQDLTVSVPADDKPPASPEHERLKAAEDA